MAIKRMSDEERFFTKIEVVASGCWIWHGQVAYGRGGYGIFSVGSRADGARRNVRAHRFAYEMGKGPIPEDLQLDHLCRVRRCVNWDHLEPVTGRVNTLRGLTLPAANASKDECKWGHPFTPENTREAQGRYGVQRICRACSRLHTKAWSEKQKVAKYGPESAGKDWRGKNPKRKGPRVLAPSATDPREQPTKADPSDE